MSNMIGAQLLGKLDRAEDSLKALTVLFEVYKNRNELQMLIDTLRSEQAVIRSEREQAEEAARILKNERHIHVTLDQLEEYCEKRRSECDELVAKEENRLLQREREVERLFDDMRQQQADANDAKCKAEELYKKNQHLSEALEKGEADLTERVKAFEIRLQRFNETVRKL